MTKFTNRRTVRVLGATLLAALLGSTGIALAKTTDKDKPVCEPGHPGYEANQAKAKCAAALGGEALTDLPAPFREVEAFATKSGFRGVVAWSTDTPIVAVVHWGTDPTALDNVTPVLDVPDTAGMVVLGDGAGLVALEPGVTYYASVEDQLSGVATPAIELSATNAYTAYGPNTEQDPTEVSFKPEVYTIDLLVQLDAESLPEEVPADQALGDLAKGINVFAERLYDAMDGYARVGNVLITDTNVAGVGSVPGYTVLHSPGSCDAPGNLADVLVTTGMPFDSHTFSYAIDEPCTPFYLGRFGQLVVPWEDDLHLGAVATHEMLHYAFGAPDLYGTGDVTGTSTGGCRNLAWDGSVMHNSGGWAGDRWELTEVDRDPLLTPCDHGGEPYTWDRAQERYTNLPEAAALEDVFNSKARGNPDGGALDIMILDREPAASTLTHIEPDDSVTSGADCPAVPGLTTAFADATGDATSVLGLADGPEATNEPALDIVGERVTLDPDAETLTIEVEVDDLRNEPASASTGEFFDLTFRAGNASFDVVAEWNRTSEGPTFVLNEWGNGRSPVGPVTGTWDVEQDLITVEVPAELTLDDGSTYAVFAASDEIRSFETTARRRTGTAVPDADRAAGGCSLRASDGGTPPPADDGVDAQLSASTPTYAFAGEPTTAAETVLAGPVAATGSELDDRVIAVDAPDGGVLTATLEASPTSYASIAISGPSGQLDYSEAPAGQVTTITTPVASGIYVVTVRYYAAVESTYAALVTLDTEAAPPEGVPDGETTLAPGGSASFDGTVPTDTVGYECAGPFDPICLTYRITVAEGGELLASIEAGIPVDDFDLSLYDSSGQRIATGGLPMTPPLGLESVAATVDVGTYYVVVQPYTATGGVSTFRLSVSLS